MTDLGYLLHKNPARLQTEELSFAEAHVLYPEADTARCTVAVLLEIDRVSPWPPRSRRELRLGDEGYPRAAGESPTPKSGALRY